MTSRSSKPDTPTVLAHDAVAKNADPELDDTQLDAAAGGFGGGIGEATDGDFATGLTKIKGHPWEEDTLGAYAKNPFRP